MAAPSSSTRRTGGQRQRLQKLEQDEAPALQKSFLASKLLESWSWGEMSPQAVQQMAALSLRDFEAAGAQPPADLVLLAQLGDSGKHLNNMHKEILRIANRGCNISNVLTLKMDFKPPFNQQLQGVLLPHVVFSDLFHHYKAAFFKFILPDKDVLKEFWRNQQLHPAFAGHPTASVASFEPSKTIPLSCHGDGTPVVGIGKIWARMLTSWSWSSLVCNGGWTKDAQLPIWFLFDETDNGETCEQFYKVLCWSFRALQTGKWPHEDHEGQKHLAFNINVSFCSQVFNLIFNRFAPGK